jgi:hypothetical protein
MNGQAADVRKSGAAAAARRELYAETMLQYARDKNWPPTVDVFHPIADLQKNGQKDDDKYTILKDTIHLTDPAYIAWGFFLYERLNPTRVESIATLSAIGKLVDSKRCKIEEIKADKDGLTFVRLDEVLPILPPVVLPPRKHVPMEPWSVYSLQIEGLNKGTYEITCEGKQIGAVTSEKLSQGVNLNSLLLDNNVAAPWETVARQIWDSKGESPVGKTRWRFEVRKVG